MRSVSDLIAMVIDGQVTTASAGRLVIDEEVSDRLRVMETMASPQTAEETRKRLLVNIGYNTGYCSHGIADKIMEVYETEHPIWGKKHPSAEEALRLGIEAGERSRMQQERNDD
jgi:nucleotidyltransferase/DNA polymerase involved in DNA repair